MPKISVIVPVYNVEKYLNRCVDSILNQTFADFEIILVDDGSTDRSAEICDNYGKLDGRIKVLHKNNEGQGEARNKGIDIAEGDYLNFLDSDDWIHPQMLEVLYNGVMSNNVKMSACMYIETKEKENFADIGTYEFSIINGTEWFMKDNINAIVPVAKLCHRDLFIDVRYPKGRKREDEFTTYKLLYNAGSVAFCDKKLYMYFVNDNGSTKQEYALREAGKTDILEKNKNGFLRYRLDYLEALKEAMFFFKERDDDAFIFTRQLYKEHIIYYFKEIYSREWAYLDDDGELIKIIRENYREIEDICNKYEKIYLYMIRHNMFRKWIAKNDFEPIQNMTRKLKKSIAK